MDDLNPKTRVSCTAAASGWLALTAVACLVLAVPTGAVDVFLTGSVVSLALGLLLGVLGLIDIGRSEGRLRGAGWPKFAFWVSGVFLFCGLLLPAVPSARESARRAQATNNLKQIGLALHNYHSVFGRFPPAVVVDRGGRPLYSWRVLILPFLEEPLLSRKFHLDEPWDSPHNQTLLAEMPQVYSFPYRRGNEQPKGHTVVQGFVGKGTAFESPQGEPLSLPDGGTNFPDGPEQTLMAVEARFSVAWTRPIDLPFMTAAQLPALGGTDRPHIGPETPRAGYLGLFVDGSVRYLKRGLGEQTLRALITRNGREPIKDEEF